MSDLALVQLLALGRPHHGLLACLVRPARPAWPAWPAPAPRRRAVSLLGALLLFGGAVLAGRALYLRGKAELAALLVRKAYDETLRTDQPTPPWPWADTFPVARLTIPALHYEEIVLEGTSARTLAFGPTRSMNSARPGEPGNLVLAGHRTSWFEPLERLAAGDTLRLAWPSAGVERRRNYRVEELLVVAPHETHLLQPTPYDVLTLVTCYPFGAGAGSPLRYVVRARPL